MAGTLSLILALALAAGHGVAQTTNDAPPPPQAPAGTANDEAVAEFNFSFEGSVDMSCLEGAGMKEDGACVWIGECVLLQQCANLMGQMSSCTSAACFVCRYM